MRRGSKPGPRVRQDPPWEPRLPLRQTDGRPRPARPPGLRRTRGPACGSPHRWGPRMGARSCSGSGGERGGGRSRDPP
ncbi:hypothetical protein NDU88_004871 [Pleurodeles waltl]|uniref:Uncharacterized protein n=1 Tax=Pleurodeles waltl TaxID=8319 RepID=A0AAV7QDX1_PLEWA|nr:hypothetical protein NDU88_004871 [Pleurodeles waltl]